MGRQVMIVRMSAAQPEVATRGELLATVQAIGDATHAIDPRVHEGEHDGLHRTADELHALLGRAIATLEELSSNDDDAHEDEDEPGAGEDTRQLDESGTAFRLSPPRLANVCFAGTYELGRVRREHAGARTLPELLVWTETARRKLLRAFRAVLDAADDDSVQNDTWRNPSSDMHAALAVRRLYASFRRGLRRPVSDAADDVLAAVRYAAGALATLVAAPSYADVRASDRALLRDLHERVIHWARTDRDPTRGAQLLDDVWTTADLLRDLHRRQELRAHDAAAVRATLAGPGDDPEGWLARLRTLAGLDDELDSLVDRLAVERSSTALLDEIDARLHQLR